MIFGVEVEIIVFFVLLGFLFFLFLFWMIILVVILWFRKINFYVERVVEIVNLLKRDNLEYKNKVFVYGCVMIDLYEDEIDLRRILFKDKCKILMKLINGFGEKVFFLRD